MAIGSLTGALLAARRGRVGPAFLLSVAALFSVIEMIAALMPTYPAYALALIPTGMSGLTVVTSANAYVQTSVLPEVRGRVMALYLMVFMGGTPVGAPVIGWAAEAFGARWSLLGGGLLVLLSTGLAALALRGWTPAAHEPAA